MIKKKLKIQIIQHIWFGGCNWDAMLLWMYNDGKMPSIDILSKSPNDICEGNPMRNANEVNWESGNYITGYLEDDKLANIYDLLGCNSDWSMVACYIYRATMGGQGNWTFPVAGTGSPAATMENMGGASSRLVLYANTLLESSKIPGKPDWNGYFTEKSTVNGETESSTNPLIPIGFKPKQDTSTNLGNTGMALWTDDNGKPSANSVRQGLVIESQTLGEYVWIPVPDINKMIMCQSKKATDQCKIIKQGNDLYCTVHKSYDICGKLYGNVTRTGNIEKETFDASKTDQTYIKNSGRREPDLVTKDDTDSESYLKEIGLTVAQFEKDMLTDFKKMAVSTYDHGGFWIGRYETSLTGTGSSQNEGNIQSKKIKIPITVSNNRRDGSSYRWYGLYDKEKTETTNYSTHMFWRM